MRAMDPLQVAMTGVRMGEKYLQVYCHDATLTRGLATKTGLSGAAALAAADDRQAARARKAADQAGVLIEIAIGSPATLAWPDQTFDMVVIDNTAGDLSNGSAEARQATLREARRVLRPGGRAEVIERLPGGGLFGAPPPPPEYARSGGAAAALEAGGFKPVRILAERDGFRFVEGLKPGEQVR
jgi:ubiquinone/menaquinone biosynthesis C-methylase UbiE